MSTIYFGHQFRLNYVHKYIKNVHTGKTAKLNIHGLTDFGLLCKNYIDFFNKSNPDLIGYGCPYCDDIKHYYIGSDAYIRLEPDVTFNQGLATFFQNEPNARHIKNVILQILEQAKHLETETETLG